MFDDQIEERVHRVQTAPFDPYLTEGLADDRLIRALDDLGVEEVPVPDPHAEPGVVVLAEPAAVAFVL